jgi:lipopolysaccharide biosynthesis glycosyltransferase
LSLSFVAGSPALSQHGKWNELPLSPTMNIAFNINPSGLPGLGGTLRSLLDNCARSKDLCLYFLASKLTGKHRKTIHELIDSCGGVSAIHFIAFEADKEFANLPPLLGDRTAYGRLVMPRLLPVDECLYLDADLIVGIDVMEALKDFCFGEHAIGAVGGQLGDSNVDHPLMHGELGHPLEMPYFNSGVLMLNLAKLRRDEAEQWWMTFAHQNKGLLGSHDQTVINAYCAGGKFVVLSDDLNRGWPAGASKPARFAESIIHFIGSPKPWDYGCKSLHQGFNLWAPYSDKAWESAYCSMSRRTVKRLWNIRRSIARVVYRRMKDRVPAAA